MHRAVALATAALLVATSSGALADAKKPAASEPSEASETSGSADEVARGLFQAGKAAYEAANYTDALNFFEQAFQRSGRPQLLYNVGQSADRLRQDQKALDAFKQYLQKVPDAPNRVEVETRIGVLERTLAERNAEPAPVAVVPTPTETAAAAPSEPIENDPAFQNTDSDDKPVTKKWWFWTGIGAVVVGGAAVALALAIGGDEAGQEPSYEGNGGSLQGP